MFFNTFHYCNDNIFVLTWNTLHLQLYAFYFEAVGLATVIWIVLINIATQV